MEEREVDFTEEMLLPSLDEAAAVFRKEGIATDLSLDRGEVPTILLTCPKRRISLSCGLVDTESEYAVFHYTLSCEGERSWSFPALYPPTMLPAFPFLPKLYECLCFGMTEGAGREAEEAFSNPRLTALQGALSSLGLTSALTEREDPSEGATASSLTILTGEEEIPLTYAFIFPELSLAVLHLIYHGEHIFLPECGEPMTATELAVLLPLLV